MKNAMSKTLFAGSVLAALAGCATPLPGLIYSDTSGGKIATSNQSGNRVGEACATSILSLIATGDASIETARRNGGITMISSVDDKFNNILFLYSKYCVVVRGR